MCEVREILISQKKYSITDKKSSAISRGFVRLHINHLFAWIVEDNVLM